VRLEKAHAAHARFRVTLQANYDLWKTLQRNLAIQGDAYMSRTESLMITIS